MELIIGLLGGLLVGLGLATVVVYIKGEALIHKIRYKVYTLPCPACRDDETDKPTGYYTPTNDFIVNASHRLTEDGKPPTFKCPECEGTKEVRYEYPRHVRPKINERRMLTSTVGERLPQKRRMKL